jgi:hypothetical protein
MSTMYFEQQGFMGNKLAKGIIAHSAGDYAMRHAMEAGVLLGQMPDSLRHAVEVGTQYRPPDVIHSQDQRVAA